MRDYLGILLVSLLSTFLIYIAKNDYFLCKLKEVKVISDDTNITEIQFWCFIVGIIWAGALLPINHVRQKKENKKKTEVLNELIEYNKGILFKMAVSEMNLSNKTLNTRIFKPQKGIIGAYHQYLCNKRVLKLHHIKGVSDPFHHKTLKFEVTENDAQGMVGMSFKNHVINVDLDLSTNNYNITDVQRTKIGNIEFCSTIPIFNQDESKVVAVVAVDSEQKLNLDDNQKKVWKQHLTMYAAFIDKHIKL